MSRVIHTSGGRFAGPLITLAPMLSRELLEVLVCPKSKQPLVYFEAEAFLFCPASRLKYRIEAGVPVLLVDEATELGPDEAAALAKRAKDLGLFGA